MREVMDAVDAWRARGEQVALATVVLVEGTAPRPLGARLAVSSGGQMAGSVSGGCVEGAVFQVCQDVIKSGEPQLIKFGIADDEAWDVGLACGGSIAVFVERVPEQ